MDLERYCSKYQKTVEVLGKRWTPLILRALIDHPRRFSEIHGYVEGISDRLLSERLQELEAEGIVERRVLSGRPVTVEYGLTERGADLRPVLEALQVWADRWIVAAASPSPELAAKQEKGQA
jgi:DNA-binding HxlR family transcriptional regulator